MFLRAAYATTHAHTLNDGKSRTRMGRKQLTSRSANAKRRNQATVLSLSKFMESKMLEYSVNIPKPDLTMLEAEVEALKEIEDPTGQSDLARAKKKSAAARKILANIKRAETINKRAANDFKAFTIAACNNLRDKVADETESAFSVKASLEAQKKNRRHEVEQRRAAVAEAAMEQINNWKSMQSNAKNQDVSTLQEWLDDLKSTKLDKASFGPLLESAKSAHAETVEAISGEM